MVTCVSSKGKPYHFCTFLHTMWCSNEDKGKTEIATIIFTHTEVWCVGSPNNEEIKTIINKTRVKERMCVVVWFQPLMIVAE